MDKFQWNSNGVGWNTAMAVLTVCRLGSLSAAVDSTTERKRKKEIRSSVCVFFSFFNAFSSLFLSVSVSHWQSPARVQTRNTALLLVSCAGDLLTLEAAS